MGKVTKGLSTFFSGLSSAITDTVKFLEHSAHEWEVKSKQQLTETVIKSKVKHLILEQEAKEYKLGLARSHIEFEQDINETIKQCGLNRDYIEREVKRIMASYNDNNKKQPYD